ncbi:CoA-binding protein [Clostridium sp. CTA-19]
MVDEMLQLKVWAVVGASDDESKFGYKIPKRLREKGYTVYGINPKGKAIDGIEVYPLITDLPQKPDVVNMIVNPKISLSTLDQIKEAGIENVWFQPGSFDKEVLDKARALGLNIELNHCAYVELNNI